MTWKALKAVAHCIGKKVTVHPFRNENGEDATYVAYRPVKHVTYEEHGRRKIWPVHDNAADKPYRDHEQFRCDDCKQRLLCMIDPQAKVIYKGLKE